MAVVTSSLVSALRVGFQREFQDALSSAPSQWDRLSTRVPSSSAGNTYGWIGQFPKLREWSGDRSFKNIKEHGYSVMNNLYEATVDIPRTAVEDDDIGVYAPLFREMGYAAGTHPDEIVFGLLKNGMSGTCYDGKAFFAVDHPVYLNADGSGDAETVSNWLRPAAVDGTVTDGTPWFVLDVSRPLRPFIFQERTAPELQVITNPDNEFVRFQWYHDGQKIEKNGTSIYYSVPEGLLGSYFIQAYRADDSYVVSCPITFDTLTQFPVTTVYPTMVQKNSPITVKLGMPGEASEAAVIEIYNLNGQLVEKQSTTTVETTIPANMASGSYIVKVTTDSGRTTTHKIIVK